MAQQTLVLDATKSGRSPTRRQHLRVLLRRGAMAVGLSLLAAALYLCFWPVPAEPRAWHAPTPPGFRGVFAPNTRLSGLRTVDLGGEVGPEHVAVGPDGKLYAAVTSGNLLRVDPISGRREVFANTGGRVLGFDFDAQGRMIAADAMKGLLAIAADASVTLLADHLSNGDPIRYADAVVVAPDGTIYFTDASTRFSPAEWGGTYEASVLDIIEQAATGRVLAHEPRTHTTRVVAHGFSFANGIALAADGHTLFVNETGRYRLWKVDGRAHDLDIRSGSTEARVLIDNLPGYPDNLMRGRDGRIWVGLFKPRNPAADSLAERPFLRKVLLRLPRALIPLGASYGHVFAIDEEGHVTEDLQDPSGAYPETTAATETADRLYIHSLHAHAIGWLPRVAAVGSRPEAKASLEEVYVLRSIREPREPAADWCSSAKTGFAPFPSDAERFFSFWSVRSDAGKVIDAKAARVAELRGCFGPTQEPARQNFYAEVALASSSSVLAEEPRRMTPTARNSGPLGARLQGVQHFGLTVQNMERAFAFYTEVLGGTEVMSDGDFYGEPIHNTLLTDQDIEAHVRNVNPRTMGIPDLRGGAQRLDVRFIQFDNVVIELLHYRDAGQPAGPGSAFAEPLDPMSPAFPRMMHICFHIRDDVDFNRFIADLEAESARRGMTQVRANRVVTVTTEQARRAAPMTANSYGITAGKSNGWRLIYCKGCEGEQLEFVQALGPVKRVFDGAREARRKLVG